MNTALLSALHEIEVDKGIPFDTVTGVLEELTRAAKARLRGPRSYSTGRPATSGL
jgi:hypothetical protein